MKYEGPTFRIRINDRDPAAGQIAEDLTALGGRSCADLIFSFPSAASRDFALRAIRSSFGTMSVAPTEDLVAGRYAGPAPATPADAVPDVAIRRPAGRGSSRAAAKFVLPPSVLN